MMSFATPQETGTTTTETVAGYPINQPAAGINQADPFGTPGVIDVAEQPNEEFNIPVEETIVNNPINVGLEGITALIVMMAMHLGVFAMMLIYGVPLNSLMNVIGFGYLIVMVLFYGGIIVGYYLDKQIPPVILTTVLPYLYTLSMIILLVVATTLVQKDMTFVSRAAKKNVPVGNTTEGTPTTPTANVTGGTGPEQRGVAPNQDNGKIFIPMTDKMGDPVTERKEDIAISEKNKSIVVPKVNEVETKGGPVNDQGRRNEDVEISQGPNDQNNEIISGSPKGEIQ